MSSEMAFLRPKDLHKLAPLIQNLEAWAALMFLLDHEEAKLMLELLRKPTVEELYRISGKMELVQSLKKAQERVLAMQEESRKHAK